MQALVKVAPERGALELREVPRPEPGPGEVLVEVGAAAICGSDLHLINWDPVFHTFMRPPMVIGHEFAGVVAEVGPGVEHVGPGDRVVTESLLYCQRCPACLNGAFNVCHNRRIIGIHFPGGMTEAQVVPARMLHRVPPALELTQAVFVEPAAVAVHAVLVAPPRPGDVVLVTGPGPIGLLAAQIARAFGAHVYVAGAPSDQAVRLPAARAVGLATLDPARPALEALTEAAGRPSDLTIEASGAEKGLASALTATAFGGTITCVGLFAGPITVDLSHAIRREIDLRTSYIATWDDYERAIGMLLSGAIRVEPLQTRYPLADGLRAVEDAFAQRVVKPVLIPPKAASRHPA